MVSHTAPGDFHIFPKGFRWSSELICLQNDPNISFSFQRFSDALLEMSISRSLWTSGLTNEGLPACTCLSAGTSQNEASGGWWERYSRWDSGGDEVEKNKSLVGLCHRDRNLVGQLEQPKAEMAGMGEAKKELPGGELFTMVSSGSLCMSDWPS